MRTLLFFVAALSALPALAADDPWEMGCTDCTVIDPPAYMAEAIADFTTVAKEAGIADGLSGPACRGLNGNGGQRRQESQYYLRRLQ